MCEAKRKTYPLAVRAKVGLEAICGVERGQRDHPTVRRAPGAGRPLETGDPGAGGYPVQEEAGAEVK